MNPRRSAAAALLVSLTLVGPVLAEPAGTAPADARSFVQAALDATLEGPEPGYAFTETTDTGAGRLVRRFDPRRPEAERWQVVSGDGAPADEKPRRGGRRREQKLESIEIDLGTLSLVGETGTHATYRCGVLSDGDESGELSEELEATLRINRDGPYIEHMTIANRAPFSPRTMVKITRFEVAMDFAPVEPGGPAVRRAMRTRIEGRAMLLAPIDVAVDVTYDDYEQVGPPAPSER
jgi:hypothetical protein